MDVVIPFRALLDAVARLPATHGLEPRPAMHQEALLEAYLEDVARDRLFQPGPYPRLGNEVRVPPPPRDVAFRRIGPVELKGVEGVVHLSQAVRQPPSGAWTVLRSAARRATGTRAGPRGTRRR